MNVKMDAFSSEGYKSPSQKVRKITENWAANNLYCPFCGHPKVIKFENNRPVADFFCPHCNEQYELKSKSGDIKSKIMDGAYHTMISRISSNSNPSFFFLRYRPDVWVVQTLVMVPKYFFSPDIIMKRKPLANTARRRGWTGCSILYSNIPERGKIRMVEDGQAIQTEKVIERVNKIRFVSTYGLERRGWILETLKCIDRIPKRDFTLDDIYQFIPELEKKFPDNHHIHAKLRQQLQILRDRKIILFQGKGYYQKID